jgi:hypothetical protein
MGTAQGQRTVLGVGEEVTYGTAVAITRRYEINTSGIARDQSTLESQGIDGDDVMVQRAARRALNAHWAAGDVVMQVGKRGMGRLFKHALGGTPTIAQQGGTTAWLQTHIMGGLTGKSLTLQKLFRDDAGVEVDNFLFDGVKINEVEFSLEVDAIPTLRFGMDARQAVASTSTAALLALPKQAGGVFTFKDGALLVGAVPAARVLAANIQWNNALRTDGFYIGSQGTKVEPTVNARRTISGTIRVEYASSAYYDLFAADTPTSLELDMTGNLIAGSNFEEFNIIIPSVHFTGGPPVLSGVGLIEQSIPFVGSWDDVNPPIKIEYMSLDTAI